MAKFYGKIGFGETVQKSPGVWEDVITERQYRGDVIRNTKTVESGEKVNSDIIVDNSLSIVADQYANEHLFAIRYIEWAGSLWIISNVEVQRPRLILRLGGVYHGPTPKPADAP